MFKGRTLLLLLISGGLAFGAAMVANSWLQNQQPALVADDRLPVVVASMDVPYGQKLESHHVKIIHVDPKGIPEGSLMTIEEVEGKVANQNLLSGEIINSRRITEHVAGSTLAALIEPSMRAVTVRVNDVIGVAGFLLPGNRVDIIATRKIKSNVISRTVLQDIKVLAVDQKARTDKNDPVVVRAVTLEVTPLQAESLMKARDEGNIQLTLRNPLDDLIKAKEVAKAAPVVKKAKRRARVRTVSSSSVTVIRGVEAKKTKVSL
ncbi:MAG: Flp pilus assembly protein CpaB [Motiliproteus sp.]